jgi:hypothetical protein
MRKALLVVVALGCLVVPAGAPAAAPVFVSGTVLATQISYLSQSNPDGTTTSCELLSGTMQTYAGVVSFATGGVLTPGPANGGHGTLDSHTQSTIDTLQQGAQQGASAIVNIDYEPYTVCGHDIANFVMTASIRPAPAPTPPPTPIPIPVPTSTTVSGTVTRMSPLGALVYQGSSICQVWKGTLRTDAGRTIDFTVETAMSGDIHQGGIKPVDRTAFPRSQRLVQAWLLRKRAFATITYTGPIDACGLTLDAVVTAATVTVTKQQTFRWTGRVTRISAPRTASADGQSCRVWTGRRKGTRSTTVRFAVETPLTGTPPHAADRRAAKLASTLRKARTRKRRTTITASGPVIACGETFLAVVRKVSVHR